MRAPWSGRGHEDHGRQGRILEGGNGGGIDGPVVLEAGQRAKAARRIGTCPEIVRPCRRQAQQPQRVPGRGGVEHDMVVALDRLRVGEEAGKGVKGCHLHGAGTGELLLERSHLAVRDHPPVRPDHPGPIVIGGGLRVEIHHLEPLDARYRGWLLTGGHLQHVGEIRRRIGRHEQHSPAAVSEGHCGGRRDRRLADAALAGEQQKPSGPADPVDPGGVAHSGRHRTGFAARMMAA